MDRDFYITKREYELLKYVALGYNNSQIAEKMFISTHTVKAHLGNLYQKFHVYNRVQLTISSIKHGIIDINKINY